MSDDPDHAGDDLSDDDLIAQSLSRMVGRPVSRDEALGVLGVGPAAGEYRLPSAGNKKDFAEREARLSELARAGEDFLRAIESVAGEHEKITEYVALLRRLNLRSTNEQSDRAPDVIAEAASLIDLLGAAALMRAFDVQSEAQVWFRPLKRPGAKHRRDVLSDEIAFRLASFLVRETGLVPKPAYGGHKGLPRNTFCREVEAIFRIRGLGGNSAHGVVSRPSVEHVCRAIEASWKRK